MWAAIALGTGAASSAAHPFSLELNGTDVIASVPMSSIRVEMAAPGTNGSLSFTIMDPDASVAVAGWDEVRFIEHAAAPRPILFGGFVQAVKYSAWATGGRDVEVTCVGYGILLDKKVSTSTPAFTAAEVPAMDIVSAVNRYGGILTARCAAEAYQDVLTNVDSQADDEYGIANVYGWWLDTLAAPYAAGMTLRAIIEAAIAGGYFADDVFDYPAVGALYWVDSARMVRLLPLIPPDKWGITLEAYQYDRGFGDVELEVIAGTITGLVQLTYEEEESARLSSNYTAGGDAASSGWYRTDPPERAGDLQAYTADSRVWDALPNLVGHAVVDPTTAASIRGEMVLARDTPLAMWPGLALLVTASALGMSSTRARATSVSIAFAGGGTRVYTIGYGGTARRPSLVDFYAARI